MSPSFSDFSIDNGPMDMEEDAISNFSIRLKLSLTVWDFVLPETPSLPAVIGVSCQVYSCIYMMLSVIIIFLLYFSFFFII